jgi:hypothetical protein
MSRMLPASPRAGTAEAGRLPLPARIFIAAVGFRLAVSCLAALVNVTFPPHAPVAFSVLEEPHAFWDAFARWDSGWYHGIASKGYAYVEGGRSNLAFFPLYPMAMGVGGRLLGGAQGDFYFTGTVVSFFAFAAAMVLLHRLARLDMPDDAALRAVGYASVLPGAYFFGMVYSESLFLLSLVGAVLALRERRWWIAGLAGAAMTATRATGVMFVPALILIGWSSARDARERRRALVASAASLAGFGAYSVYNYWLSGDPFAWYHSITRWNYAPVGNPFAGLMTLASGWLAGPSTFLAENRLAPYETLNALSALGSLALLPWIWRRFGLPYAAVILLGLILPLSSGQMEGLSRYSAVLFPVPLALAASGGTVRHPMLLAALAMWCMLGLAHFVTNHPI